MSSKHSQLEHSDADEVSSLLKGLPKVTAPSNFDLRVRAKIAERAANSNSRRRNRWLVQIAAPACIVATAALIIYLGAFRTDTGQQIAMELPAGTVTQLPEVEDSYITQLQPADQRPANVSPQMPTAMPNLPINSVSTNSTNRRPASVTGSSEDRAASAADAPLMPPGFSPAARGNDVPPGSTVKSVFSVGEILELVGIRADVSGGNWTVRSVDANGAAGRSGVQPGDVIVAIDRTLLNERSVINGPANVRSITVRRGTSVIQLSVGN